LLKPVLFYTAMTVYFNGLSGAATPTSVPWVNDFASRPSGASVIVLNSDFGQDPAGLYVHMVDPVSGNKFWKLALPLAALSAALASASTFQVIINASGSTTFAAPNVVYANGQVVSGGAIAASSTVAYVVTTPPTGGTSVFTVATLPTGTKGARAFVSDANATTFNTVLVGGGANNVPVFHDGTTWRIG